MIHQDGGGAIFQEGGKLTIIDSFFENNTSSTGGAISTNASTTINISNTIFDNNKATSGNGGALQLYAAATKIEDSTFTNNTSSSNGGAIMIDYKSNVTLSGTTKITGNTATMGSGINFTNGTLNIKDILNINGNTNSSTAGDVYLTPGKTMTIVGDLKKSDIGVLTATKPTSTTTVDVALPGTGYIVNENYYEQFTSNDTNYINDNMVYQTNNNKIILESAYKVTYDFNGGTLDGNSTKIIPIYPAGYIPSYKIFTPSRPGYTFEGWKDQGGNIVNLSNEYVDSDRTYIAQWKVKKYVVSFTTQFGGTLSGNANQNVNYGEYATSGAVSTPISSEYDFVGWSYRYTTETGVAKSGTVDDYTTILVEGNIEFEAVFAKKPFVSVVSTGNGNVSISKTGDKTPTLTNDKWEVNTVVDPLPVNAIIKYQQANGYVLDKITFEDLYGNEYEIDTTIATEQDFEVGNTGNKSTVKIFYDKTNKKLTVNGIETTQKYKYEFRVKDENKIVINNELKGNMANILKTVKYTVTGVINETTVTNTYYLGAGESITLNGFDTGTAYQVVQEELTDYESEIDIEVDNTQLPIKENLTIKGTFTPKGKVTATYTNSNNVAPYTGIKQIDNEVIIATVAILAILIFIKLKKKKK